LRFKRNGGPEPHAAKDGWIALRRDRHIPAASTKQKCHPCGGFFVCAGGWDENPPVRKRGDEFQCRL